MSERTDGFRYGGEHKLRRDRLSTMVTVGGYALAAAAGAYALFERHKLRKARIDHLSGALNKEAFENELIGSVKRLHRTSRGGDAHALALIFVDGDNFKAVNENYGHMVGDSVIRITGQALNSAVRSQDGDRVGRTGGDEFAVLLSVYGDEDPYEVAEFVSQRINGSINARLLEETGTQDRDMPEELTVSTGVAVTYRDDTMTADELYATANAHMRENKQARRTQSSDTE